MVFVARFVSAKWVPIHMPIGSRIPMYCTGSGRAYLSALPEDDARRLLKASRRAAHTVHTKTDIEEIASCCAPLSARAMRPTARSSSWAT